MLPIVALPNSFLKIFGYGGLEGTDHNRDGSGMRDPNIFKNQNAMEMVRHDDESIKRHPGEMLRYLVPAGRDHIGNGAEHWSSITRAQMVMKYAPGLE